MSEDNGIPFSSPDELDNPFPGSEEVSQSNDNNHLNVEDSPHVSKTISTRMNRLHTYGSNREMKSETRERLRSVTPKSPRNSTLHEVRARKATATAFRASRDRTGSNHSKQPVAVEDKQLDFAFSLENTVDVDMRHDLLYKIIIVGESGVGKTNLLGRWMDNKFFASSATINVEFAAKSFQVKGQIVKVQLWDTAGQEQYRAITRSYYRKANGAILVYDITNAFSFERLEDWLQDVKDAPGNENTQILLVGNKADLEEKRQVPTERGIEFSRQYGLNFLEASALSGNNVNRAFQIVLQDIYKLSEKFSKLNEEHKINIEGKSTVVLTGNTEASKPQDCCDTSNIGNSITSFFK